MKTVTYCNEDIGWSSEADIGRVCFDFF